MSSSLNYQNLKSQRTASSLVSEGVNSGQISLDEIDSEPLTVRSNSSRQSFRGSSGKSLSRMIEESEEPMSSRTQSFRGSSGKSLSQMIEESEEPMSSRTQSFRGSSGKSLSQMIEESEEPMSSRTQSFRGSSGKSLSRMIEESEEEEPMSSRTQSFRGSSGKSLSQMIQEKKEEEQMIKSEKISRFSSTKLERDLERVESDVRSMRSPSKTMRDVERVERDVRSMRSPSKTMRDVERVERDVRSMRSPSKTMRDLERVESDVRSMRDLERVESDVRSMREEIPMKSLSSEKKSLSQLINEAKTKSMRSKDSLSSSIRQKFSREQNSLDSVKFSDVDATVSGDLSSPISSRRISSESSFLTDLKKQMHDIGVVVTGTVSFDDSQGKVLLESYTSKSTPFYVIVKTSKASSVFFPKSHTVLSRHYGSKSTISDTIPVSDCENLPVCDILYSCDSEFCYLKKTENKVEMTEFTLAAQKPSVESLHIQGATIARPVVSFEELISNPVETLQLVESTSDSLFNNDYKNVNVITTNILRKLTAAAYDSIDVQNTFQEIFVSLNAQEEELLALLGDTNDSGISKLETERLSQLYKMKEHLLASMNYFNKVEMQVDEVNRHLHQATDKMRKEINEYFTSNYPFPISDKIFFRAEEIAKTSEPMELSFSIA